MSETEKVRILCVDDERNVLRALERTFMDDDYELIIATSGDEGLSHLKAGDPIQIIISDYRMPGMNGVDFLKEVYVNWPETVRIVLSGYADMSSIVGAINDGHIYKFIAKPWNDDELKVTIVHAIERYFLHKRNAELTLELARKNAELIQVNEELQVLLDKKSQHLELRSRVLDAHHNILNTLPVGIIGIDVNGIIMLCNAAWKEIFAGDIWTIGEELESHRLFGYFTPFLSEVRNSRTHGRRMHIDSVSGTLYGAVVEHGDGESGVIVVFSPEVEHYG